MEAWIKDVVGACPNCRPPEIYCIVYIFYTEEYLYNCKCGVGKGCVRCNLYITSGVENQPYVVYGDDSLEIFD